jgi:UDP-glucose 4-epimerase
VIVSSGGTIYGKAQNLPVPETHPTNPISPYGITKLAIEKYAMMFHEVKGLPVVCVRPSNAFGEGQKPFIGQGFVATAIVSILKKQKVILFGETGTIRDYIHVTDVANGIVAALEQGNPGMCYNLGSGFGRSNRAILDAILPFADLAKLQVQTEILPPRRFDVPANVLDCKKLIHETGWKINIPFEEGIRRTWSWFYNEDRQLELTP